MFHESRVGVLKKKLRRLTNKNKASSARPGSQRTNIRKSLHKHVFIKQKAFLNAQKLKRGGSRNYREKNFLILQKLSFKPEHWIFAGVNVVGSPRNFWVRNIQRRCILHMHTVNYIERLNFQKNFQNIPEGVN